MMKATDRSCGSSPLGVPAPRGTPACRRAIARRTLHGLVRSSADARLIHRLDCVLAVGAGHGCGEVAEWFGESPRTIERWVRRLRDAGVDGLREQHHGGRRPTLGEAERRDLRRVLIRPPSLRGIAADRWSGPAVRRYLARRHGIALSARQCQRLLRELAPRAPAPPPERGRPEL